MVSLSAQAGPSSEGQQVETPHVSQRCCAGLAFVLDSGNDVEGWDPQYALTNIAQVSGNPMLLCMLLTCHVTTHFVSLPMQG